MADYSQVGILGPRYKSVNVSAPKRPGSPNCFAQIDGKSQGAAPAFSVAVSAVSVPGVLAIAVPALLAIPVVHTVLTVPVAVIAVAVVVAVCGPPLRRVVLSARKSDKSCYQTYHLTPVIRLIKSNNSCYQTYTRDRHCGRPRCGGDRHWWAAAVGLCYQ